MALAGLYSDEERWADLDKVLHVHADAAPTVDARARLLAQAAELEEQQLDDKPAAIATWNLHYNYHRPHTAVGDQPPASHLHTGVTNVRPNNN